MNTTTKVIIFVVIVVVVALGVFLSRNNNTATAYQDYQIIEMSQAPEQIQNKYQHTKVRTGFYTYNDDNTTYLLINRGQVNTGGHTIEIKEILKSKDEWTVKVDFIPPGPGEFVTQAIAYPAIVVEIPEKVEDIKVIADGKQLQQFK
mgnify:CR=1 FL=1